MIDKFVKDLGDETKPPRLPEEDIEELINKINEIIDWINTND